MARQSNYSGRRNWFLASPLRLMATLGLLVVLPLFTLGELNAQEARTRVHADQLALTELTAQQAAASLNGAIARVKQEVAAIAFRPASGRPTALLEDLQRGNTRGVEAQLSTLQAIIGQGTILLTDEAGVVLVDTDGLAVGSSIGTFDRETPATPLVSTEPFMYLDPTSGVRGGATGSRVIAYRVSAYIERARGESAVHLRATLSLKRLAADTLLPIFPSVDELYLVDALGRLILRKSSALSPDASALADLSSWITSVAAGGIAAARFDGTDPFTGEPRSLGSAVIPDNGWRVIVAQKATVTEKDLDVALAQQRLLRVVLLTLLLVAAFLFSRATTRISRLAGELEDTNLALRHATEAKSRFLATMSHELRTPLNAILGFSDVLLQGIFGQLNEKQRDYLNDIHSSGAHQLSLINDLLDLSKVEAGRLELELAEVSVAETIATGITLVRERAASQGVSGDALTGKEAAPRRRLFQPVQYRANLSGGAELFA